MRRDLLATIVEEGTRLVSDLVRMSAGKKSSEPAKSHPAKSPVVAYKPKSKPPNDKELSYRWECCVKHLGGAAVLLREAYERANDEGMGDGTAEKIVEAMNEHAGAEPDLEKMLGISQGKEVADKLLSGVRAFRKAAWEAKLPTGEGTKQDIEDARLWNSLMLSEAIASAKKHPGTECVAEGM